MSRSPTISGESALLFEAFRRAAGGEVITVPFRDKGQAVRFTQRMHNLRRRMQKEHHELFQLFDRVVVRRPMAVATTEYPYQVIIEPRDNDFAESLLLAGITLENIQLIEEASIPPPDIEKATAQINLDKVLKDLYSK